MPELRLHELDTLPPGLLEVPATGLAGILPGPTLIHLPGRRQPALFLSVLMHGNETTGWEAVRQLLGRYQQQRQELPRTLSLFIGNVAAAAHGQRRLPGQPDYNRVWPGTELPESPERALMRDVVQRLRRRGLFASIDIHNNTGVNPHYACVNFLDNRFLHLAVLFGRTVVYFTRPRGVQSMALAELCPAVTLECGKAGHAHGAEHAVDYIDACLRLAEHPSHALSGRDIDLFHTVATVRVPADVSFGFGAHGVDIRFAADLDHLNFRELPAGTHLGCVREPQGIPLQVQDEAAQDVADRFFELDGEELRTRCPVMPSMLTLDEQVIRQDCLCYLMERYSVEKLSATA